jgi:DNA-binding transcriptional MocR family regulator
MRGTATPKLAYALSQAGTSRSGGAASNLTGELVGHALASGGLETHIRETLLPAYEKRWRVMYNAIETHLTPLGVTMPFAKTTIGNLFDEHDGINEFHTLKEGREQEVVAGGYFTYIRLPHGISAGSLAQKAEVEEMLIVTPESMCRVPRRNIGEESVTNDHDEYVRLCFAWEDEDGLVEGVMRLATVLEKMIKGDTDNFSPKSGETTSRDVYG